MSDASTDPIDVAALALLNEMATQTGHAPWLWGELSEPQKEYYRRCARAVKESLNDAQ